MERHLPGAVGILLKGVAVCAIGAIAHFALGVDVESTLVGTCAGTALGAAGRALLDRRSK